MQQGKALFARLVRMLLGETAISESKLAAGSSLVILGVLVRPMKEGVFFSLCKEKTMKWLEVLRKAADTRKLDVGEAQKLSGKLMWRVLPCHSSGTRGCISAFA